MAAAGARLESKSSSGPSLRCSNTFLLGGHEAILADEGLEQAADCPVG